MKNLKELLNTMFNEEGFRVAHCYKVYGKGENASFYVNGEKIPVNTDKKEVFVITPEKRVFEPTELQLVVFQNRSDMSEDEIAQSPYMLDEAKYTKMRFASCLRNFYMCDDIKALIDEATQEGYSMDEIERFLIEECKNLTKKSRVRLRAVI